VKFSRWTSNALPVEVAPPGPLTFVLNFSDELRRRVPQGNNVSCQQRQEFPVHSQLKWIGVIVSEWSATRKLAHRGCVRWRGARKRMAGATADPTCRGCSRS
jgi:hypothetical protein